MSNHRCTNMELHDIVKIAKATAEQHNGEHPSSFIIEKDNALKLFVVSMENDLDKLLAVKAIEQLVKRESVDMYCSVFGAWMAQEKPKEGKRISELSKDEKQEIIVVSKHTKQGTWSAICPFSREDDKEEGALIWGEEIHTNPEISTSYDRFNIWIQHNIVIGERKNGGD